MKIGRAALLFGLLGCVSTFAALEACGRPELPITVQKARAGLHSDVQPGDRVEFVDVASSGFAGGKPGFYALRTKYDFEVFRSDLPNSRALPPKDVIFGEKMVVAGYSSDANVDKLSFESVVDAGSSGIHVYAVQYTAGDGCPTPQPGAGFDLIALPMSEKPVTVHLDTDRGAPCQAAAPKAKPVCRVAGSSAWNGTLSAPWQSNIECEMQIEPGAHPIIDRNWLLQEVAKGSTTKLTMAPNGARVTFPLDTLGHFAVQLEVFDDEGRRGELAAKVDSIPPSDDTYLQFGWSSFTASDEIDTFPRLDVRASEPGPSEKPKAKAPSRPSCSVQGQHPSWCEVTSTPIVTLMRVSDSPGRYNVSVRYLDDRYKGMPIACVRIFRKRQFVSELCDDTARKSGETWEPGIVISAQGMFEQMIAADAGAPDGSADGSAGDGAAPPSDVGAATSDAGAAKPAKKK